MQCCLLACCIIGFYQQNSDTQCRPDYNVTCFSFIFQVYFKCLISWLDVKLFFHTFLDFWIRYALFWCSCWLLSQVSSCYSSSDKFGWFLFCWASKQQNYSLFGICHLEIFPENMDFISMWKSFLEGILMVRVSGMIYTTFLLNAESFRWQIPDDEYFSYSCFDSPMNL